MNPIVIQSSEQRSSQNLRRSNMDYMPKSPLPTRHEELLEKLSPSALRSPGRHGSSSTSMSYYDSPVSVEFGAKSYDRHHYHDVTTTSEETDPSNLTPIPSKAPKVKSTRPDRPKKRPVPKARASQRPKETSPPGAIDPYYTQFSNTELILMYIEQSNQLKVAKAEIDALHARNRKLELELEQAKSGQIPRSSMRVNRRNSGNAGRVGRSHSMDLPVPPGSQNRGAVQGIRNAVKTFTRGTFRTTSDLSETPSIPRPGIERSSSVNQLSLQAGGELCSPQKMRKPKAHGTREHSMRAGRRASLF